MLSTAYFSIAWWLFHTHMVGDRLAACYAKTRTMAREYSRHGGSVHDRAAARVLYDAVWGPGVECQRAAESLEQAAP
jgi:hypothetical protein